MKRSTTIAVLVACISAATGLVAAAADKPVNRVVAIYFHRTERCPTCKTMGSYAEEAVVKGFAEQVKKGLVAFHYVDFQDKANAALAKGYKISGPALVVAQIRGGKVKQYRNLDEIWMKVQKKDEFLKYVRDHVEALRK